MFEEIINILRDGLDIKKQIAKAISGIISLLVNGIYELFGDLLDNMFKAFTNVANSSVVTGITTFTSAVALALLFVMVAKKIVSAYGFSYSDAEDPLGLLERTATAVFFIAANGVFFKILVDISSNFIKDFEKQMSISASPLQTINDFINSATLQTLSSALLMQMIIMCCCFVGYIIFFFVAAIRGAELVIAKILFPLAAATYVDENSSILGNYTRAYLSLFLGYLVQLICFNFFAYYLSLSITTVGIQTAVSFGLVIGFLALMIRGPKIVDRYLLPSGTGRQVGSAGRILSRTVLSRISIKR